MSNKKRHYPFNITDKDTGHEYRLVISSLWKVDDGVTPPSKQKVHAYAFNVFRKHHGWVGGGSFIELDHRPTDNDALQALAVVLQRESQVARVANVEVETGETPEDESVDNEEADVIVEESDVVEDPSDPEILECNGCGEHHAESDDCES
jgi:hypothetical protein